MRYHSEPVTTHFVLFWNTFRRNRQSQSRTRVGALNTSSPEDRKEYFEIASVIFFISSFFFAALAALLIVLAVEAHLPVMNLGIGSGVLSGIFFCLNVYHIARTKQCSEAGHKPVSFTSYNLLFAILGGWVLSAVFAIAAIFQKDEQSESKGESLVQS